jgi:cytoskeleton protein RodZ
MESDKESQSFGRYLQTIRLEKKISLEQVSQQTRIGLGNLLLIEQENHEQLPAEVYVKGFLRSYAKSIGADGDEVIRRYESCHDVQQRISEAEFTSKKMERGLWQKILVLLVLVSCIIGLSIFAVVFFRQAPVADKPLEQKTAAENEQALEAQAEQQDLEAGSKQVIAVPEKLLLHVTAVEDTWLKAIVDEKGSTEYNLKSGDQIEIEAASGFNLLIGNAGGLKITLNDKPVSIPGKSGEVVTIELP